MILFSPKPIADMIANEVPEAKLANPLFYLKLLFS